MKTTVPTYTPDRWVIVQIHAPEDENPSTPIYKVFACFYGGFEKGDSWKLNSGITQVTPATPATSGAFDFHGHSGSIYRCYPGDYGTHFYGSGVLNDFIQKARERGGRIEVLPKETPWLSLPLIPEIPEIL